MLDFVPTLVSGSAPRLRLCLIALGFRPYLQGYRCGEFSPRVDHDDAAASRLHLHIAMLGLNYWIGLSCVASTVRCLGI